MSASSASRGPSVTRRETRGVILASLLCSSGCDVVPGEWLSIEDSGVTFYYHPGTEVCGEDVERVRRLADEISDATDLPRIPAFSYYLLDPDELSSFCPGSACADPDRKRVFASKPGYVHEIAHLILPPGVLFFNEGLADYLDKQTGFYVSESFDILEVLNDEPDDLRNHRTLVAFLVENYGMESVVELLHMTHRGMGASEFVEVYEAIFGTHPSTHVEALLGWVPQWEQTGGRPWNTCRGFGPETTVSPGTSVLHEPTCSSGYGPPEAPRAIQLVAPGPDVNVVKWTGPNTFMSCERQVDAEFDEAGEGPVWLVGELTGRWALEATTSAEAEFYAVRLETDCDANSVGRDALTLSDRAELWILRGAIEAIPFQVELPTSATTANPLEAVEICDEACDCAELVLLASPLLLEPGRTYWARRTSGGGISSSPAKIRLTP